MRIKAVIAVILYRIGVKPKVTCDIVGNARRGYGKLYALGCFQFPLSKKYK